MARKEMHSGHMEHTISNRQSGISTRNSKCACDVPRISPVSSVEGGVRMNPGAAGGTDAGNSAKKIPVAGPPKGRGLGEGRP